MGERPTLLKRWTTVPATRVVTRSAWWLWVALFVVSITCPAAGQADSVPRVIEVFSTTDVPVAGIGGAGGDSLPAGVEVQVYRLDEIDRLESALSRELPGDPDSAGRVALDRIQRLDDQARQILQRSAVGLAKAVQYGIDRTPAVVFDGKVVVYGVTDLGQALGHYQQWRARGLR